MIPKDVLDIFPGARIFTAEGARNVIEIDTAWAAIKAERDRWQLDDEGVWHQIAAPKPEHARSDCGRTLIEARWPDGNVTIQCHGCGKALRRVEGPSRQEKIKGVRGRLKVANQ